MPHGSKGTDQYLSMLQPSLGRIDLERRRVSRTFGAEAARFRPKAASHLALHSRRYTDRRPSPSAARHELLN
jgi:hypothetical protein